MKYFFVAVHEQQLTDFANIHKQVSQDEKTNLQKLSQMFNTKLIIEKYNKMLNEVDFTCRRILMETIEQVPNVVPFLYLTDISDNELSEAFSPAQFARYGNITELIQKAKIKNESGLLQLVEQEEESEELASSCLSSC